MAKKIRIAVWLSACLLTCIPLQAQNSLVDLDLQADPAFSQAQVIDYMSLIFDGSGQGERIFSLFLQNTTTEPLEDIYIEYNVNSTRSGLIFEAKQSAITPFTLQPGQVISANNNDLAASVLAGISHPVHFYGELTSAGRSLLNRLLGGSSLPLDLYTITMDIYQRGTSEMGGILLESSSVTTGENLFDDDFSIYLLGPGDLPGSEVTISNSYPEFRWEGLPDLTYRLVVVKEVEGESPSSLIESALSTNPAHENESASLLRFEHLDVLVDGTRYQFPSWGAQALQEGETYYWQIFAGLEGTLGEELLSSEIWSFLLSGTGGRVHQVVQDLSIQEDRELLALLNALLGENTVAELVDNGFQLESVEMDQAEYRGLLAREQLERLLEKVREGTVKFTSRP